MGPFGKIKDHPFRINTVEAVWDSGGNPSARGNFNVPVSKLGSDSVRFEPKWWDVLPLTKRFVDEQDE